MLILNKVDLVPRDRLLAATKSANDMAQFEATFMISALTGDGVADLALARRASGRALAFSGRPDFGRADAALAAEITREKLFLRLHQELPYHSTVETESWKELRGGDSPDRADDLCRARKPAQDRDRQGRGDHQGDRRSGAARLAEIAEAKVHLFLFVKVREGWGDDPDATGRWGWSFRRNRR